MSKNAITWIREDFRIEHNPALSYATQNHESVIALYIFNKDDFDNKREAQRWWLSKSLEIFKSELSSVEIASLAQKSTIHLQCWNTLTAAREIFQTNKARNLLVEVD